MVPAGDPTEDTIDSLGGLLAPGDVVIDGGNSNWRDSVRRAERARRRSASGSSTPARAAACGAAPRATA